MDGVLMYISSLHVAREINMLFERFFASAGLCTPITIVRRIQRGSTVTEGHSTEWQKLGFPVRHDLPAAAADVFLLALHLFVVYVSLEDAVPREMFY